MKASQQRIYNALEGMDNERIKKIYAILFDIWCWDSGNDNLKEIVDTLHSIIEDPSSCPVNVNQQESSITHTSNGITNEIFRFNWGSLILGSDLEVVLNLFLEERLFSLFNGSGLGSGISLDSQLNNCIDIRILNHYKITTLESEILVLRSDIEELKKKIDNQ